MKCEYDVSDKIAVMQEVNGVTVKYYSYYIQKVKEVDEIHRRIILNDGLTFQFSKDMEYDFVGPLGQEYKYSIVPLTVEVRQKAFFSKIGRIFKMFSIPGDL